MWKRFAPRDAIGKAFQLKYAVKRIIYLRQKNYFVIEKACSS